MLQTPKLHLTFIKQVFYSQDSLNPEAKTSPLYIPKQNYECCLIFWGLQQRNIPKNRLFMMKTETKILTTDYHLKYSTEWFYFFSTPQKRCLWIVSCSCQRRRKERLIFSPTSLPFIFLLSSKLLLFVYTSLLEQVMMKLHFNAVMFFHSGIKI